MNSKFYVYILTNKYNTVIYTGFTNDLARRCQEHKTKRVSGFTSKYNIYKLVYFEAFKYVNDGIKREKQIKNYSREKKDALINFSNPGWNDLCPDGVVNLPIR